MADYAQMSDQELDAAIHAKQGTTPQHFAGAAPDYSKMSDQELDAAIHEKQGTAPSGMIRQGLDYAGRALDYPGGFVRTGLAAGAAGLMGGKKGVVTDDDFDAAVRGQAPNSAEYMKRLGVGEGPSMHIPIVNADVSARDAGGLALDIATDPLTALAKAGKGLPYVGKALGFIGEGAGKATESGLKNFAEKTAVNATGATGKEAAKFAPGAGRELLDEGIVRFGDSQAKIAERAGQGVNAAEAQIDEALKKLDAAGVKVDANDVYNRVRSRIDELGRHASSQEVAAALDKELENIIKASDVRGSVSVPVSEAEVTKRDYNRKAGNWNDPDKSLVGKEMYQAQRHAVEDAATAANPETAKLFEEGKKAYGFLDPIREAAERRAATTSQSPWGGLLDLGAAAVATAIGGPLTAIPAIAARRFIAPRLASSAAVSADKIADLLRTTGVLDPALRRGLIRTLEEKQLKGNQ